MVPRDVSFAKLNGESTLEIGQKRPRLGQIENEVEGVVLGVEISPDVQSVVGIRREITMLNPAVQFEYSLDDMIIRSSEVRGSSG
jgi:hypothetical protein